MRDLCRTVALSAVPDVIERRLQRMMIAWGGYHPGLTPKTTVAELLELAEESDDGFSPLRVCVVVSEEVQARLSPLTLMPDGPELPLLPAEKALAYIHAPNSPGFFWRLAVDGAATLGCGDSLVMLDGSGWIWADGMTVRLPGLRLLVEDVDEIVDHEWDDLADALTAAAKG